MPESPYYVSQSLEDAPELVEKFDTFDKAVGFALDLARFTVEGTSRYFYIKIVQDDTRLFHIESD